MKILKEIKIMISVLIIKNVMEDGTDIERNKIMDFVDLA